MNIILFLIGLYIFLECISAAANMHKGDRFCRMFAYLLGSLSGLYAMAIAWQGIANTGHILVFLSLALFLWPRMIYRVLGGQRANDYSQRTSL